MVDLYARQSRITNKGDNIGVQFKQSADYAVNQLLLQEDYELQKYEDKGLGGYYSDRPGFQHLLCDIEMGKIKAAACYKSDRISRKTSDLMRLLEYFERHDVTLLICSNNINTRISTSKIIIQVLAIIAEFERDILTERIQDNLTGACKRRALARRENAYGIFFGAPDCRQRKEQKRRQLSCPHSRSKDACA